MWIDASSDMLAETPHTRQMSVRTDERGDVHFLVRDDLSPHCDLCWLSPLHSF